MAIEATCQLFNATSGARAYLFKQVIIHKALLVPFGEIGVETQLNLRPSNQPKDRFASWVEFRLYAFENDAWTEICQGYIAVRYEYHSDSDSQQIRETYQRGAGRCNIRCYSGSLYRFLHAHGINFGPCFRGLKGIRFNNFGEATATANLQAWQTGAANANIQPHVIHPIALDAALQTGFPAMSQGGRKSIATMIPTAIPALTLFVEDDYFSRYDSNTTENTGDVEIYATSKPRGFRNIENTVTALHSNSGKPFLTATIECTSASGIQKPLQNEEVDIRRYYYMDWKPNLDLLDTGGVSSYCSSRACEPVKVFNRMLEEKELICRIGLQQLSDAKSSSVIVKYRPHLQRYMSWMDHQLVQTGPENAEAYKTELRCLINDEARLTKLYRKTENSDAEGELIVRVARSLLKVISGEIDALELLFTDNLMNDYYEYGHQKSKAFRDILPYVDAWAHKQPDLKILEIGAGTGGATQGLLDLLTHCVATNSFNPRFAEYVFTDISAEFFEKAKVKYKQLQSRMTFATLNIEQDPMGQGFEEERYDTVVASNVGLVCPYCDFGYLVAAAKSCKVLHATKDLRSTLQNTRKLLKS